MKLIIGLGNPEEKYENTRHNVGFNTINKISEKYQIPVNKEKFSADNFKSIVLRTMSGD